MSTDLIINVNPKSIFSEAIKTIRTNLAFSNIGKENKIILVTSPQSGDGKSFIAANLAVAYAQEDKKVLVIDCDLRKGRQHEIFEVMNLTSGGYSNLILNYKDDVKLKNILLILVIRILTYFLQVQLHQIRLSYLSQRITKN